MGLCFWFGRYWKLGSIGSLEVFEPNQWLLCQCFCCLRRSDYSAGLACQTPCPSQSHCPCQSTVTRQTVCHFPYSVLSVTMYCPYSVTVCGARVHKPTCVFVGGYCWRCQWRCRCSAPSGCQSSTQSGCQSSSACAVVAIRQLSLVVRPDSCRQTSTYSGRPS